MRRTIVLLFMFSVAGSAAVVIDRIAVVVGKHVVKLSDIDRDLRVTDFLNNVPLSESPDAKRKAADRLVDQQIIREELATGGYSRAKDSDADAMLRRLLTRRRAALSGYGLTEDQLRTQLVWQLTVLSFIDQRFRPGVLVTDEDVKTYYDQHPELHKSTFEVMSSQIRNTLEGEQVNQQFEAWLDAARKRERIEFREEAFK